MTYFAPAAQRYPEDGSVALERDHTDLSTSYVWTDWFPAAEWPVFAAMFRFQWASAGSGVTSYEFKGQGRGPAGPAVDLRTTLAGTTTTTVEHTMTDGGAHDYGALLQTTDQLGYDFVRFGFKYTSAGALASGDAATIQVVKGMWT